jgi:hypothetical protein
VSLRTVGRAADRVANSADPPGCTGRCHCTRAHRRGGRRLHGMRAAGLNRGPEVQ